MIIDNHLLGISKTIFQNREQWEYVTDKQKEEFFFIFNRMFSKLYHKESQLLNLKNIDKISGMNLWYYFMKDKPYPKWFWSKQEKKKSDIVEKDYKLLLSKLKIKDIDLDYLIERKPDFIKEELKYFKSQEKGN